MTVPKASLFRPEALAVRDAHFSHSGSHPLPLSQRILSLLAVMFIATVAALLYHGKYTARHAVRGVVTTTQANVRVVARQPGTVTEIFIGEGSVVARGAALLRIEDLRHTANGDVNAALVDSLRNELAAVDAELRHLETQAANDARAADRSLKNSEQQLAALQLELQLAQSQRELSDQQHLRLLEAGSAVSEQDVEQAAAQVLAADSRLSTLLRQILEQRAVRDELQFRQSNIPAQLAIQVAGIASRRERVQQQLLTVTSAADITVRAPMAGRTSALRVRQGESVTAGQTMLTLLPASAEFVVDLLVPDRAAGLLTRGADVRLRFDAFPHQQYGVWQGRVSSVSATTVFSSDKPDTMTQTGQGYLARVELTVPNDGLALPLRAGMTVTADILRDERRLIDWLVAPLRGIANELRQ